MPRKPRSGAARRKAAILLVSVVLLMLFLVIGLCFVLFADSQATSSRTFREAQLNIFDKFPTAEEMFNHAMGSIIYDSTDDAGVYSSIRGHGLARNMYGWNYVPNAADPTIIGGVANNTPFNGAGRPSTGVGTFQNSYNIDDRLLINYMAYNNDPTPFKRDPERMNPAPTLNGGGLYTGGFNVPYTAPDLNNCYLAEVALAPDVGNQAGLMQIVRQSYWRGDDVGFRHPSYPVGPTLSAANRAWTDPSPALRYLRYMSMRPRPADQLLASEPQTEAQVNALLAAGQIFPRPASPQGDVRNLPGPPTLGMDSVWVDLGYPVTRLAATQRKVKPLFAILIVDMDGRVNYNVAGNVKEAIAAGLHGSNQGFGPWEVNPRWLMRQTNDPFGPTIYPLGGDTNEYLDTFRGGPGVDAIRGNADDVAGRYGKRSNVLTPNYPPFPPIGPPPPYPNPAFPVPNAASLPYSPPGSAPYYYARVDFDGSTVMGAPVPGPPKVAMSAPGTYTAFPTFPPYYQDGNPEERFFHPSLFNPFMLNRPPYSTGVTLSPDQADRMLPIADIQGLIAWTTPRQFGAAGGPPFHISPDTFNTELAKLWPTNIRRYPRLRNLVTPLSTDLDRMGAAPGVHAQPYGGVSTVLQLDASVPPGANRLPAGAPTIFNNNNAAQSLLPNRQALLTPGGDLRPDTMQGAVRVGDWRSFLADLARVDLNRPLTNYPVPAPGSRPDFTNPAIALQFDQARRDRTRLAQDIFTRLRFATGAADPANFIPPPLGAGIDPTGLPLADPNRQQFEALRYLGQLAANIVDFIDGDDVMTVYNFLADQIALGNLPPWGWVYGTELPRLVINEAYAQVQNDPNDNFGFNAAPNLAYQPGGTSDPDTPSGTMMNRPFMTMPPVPPAARAQMDYRVNFFVELHNPHNADPNLSDGGAARLQLSDNNVPVDERAIYRLQIRSQVDAVATRAADNVLGIPQGAPTPNIDIKVLNWNSDIQPPMGVDPTLVLPSQGAYGDQMANSQRNNGYLVVGPSATGMGGSWQAEFPNDRDPDANQMTPPPPPRFRPTLAITDQAIGGNPSRMYATLDRMMHDPSNVADPMNATYRPAVFLQRLANPLLPPQPNAGVPLFNPYVTVDYIGEVPINDAALYDVIGKRDGAGGRPQRTPIENRRSVGRRQPFKAWTNGVWTSGGNPTWSVTDQSPNPAETSMPQNTMFRQNGQGAMAGPGAAGTTLDQPFSWLVHYDRKLANPTDVLHVSGYKPHELTQMFLNADPTVAPTSQTMTVHQAPWRNSSSRLYRALESLGVQSFQHGVAFGGKTPGKININTMTDVEIWQALTDLNAGSYFDAATLNTLWTAIRNNRPFWGSAVPNSGVSADSQYQNLADPRTGAEKTLMRHDPTSLGDPVPRPFFNVNPGPTVPNHPYVQEELLKKIFANTTTRSNVFAVYITTGFFAVRDDSVAPVKLGAEVDPTLRHRMFAVVDRTNLTQDQLVPRNQGPRPIFMRFEPITPGPPNTAGNPNNIETMVSIGDVQAEAIVPAYTSAGNTLIVRDTIDHNAQEFGQTSGEFFTIGVGTRLFIDVGMQAEQVVVTEVHINTSTIKFAKVGGGGFGAHHYRGCPICTQQLGNPGPQNKGAIEPDKPPYSNTVVPFRAILQ